MSQDSFADLLARLRAGDQAAATKIFERYVHDLVALASRRLVGSIRQKVDPEDLVQSAFKSFFRRDAAAPFPVEGWQNLWSLLATITLRKVGFQIRHFLADMRSVKREATLPEDASGHGWDMIAREPTPEEAVVLSDTLAEILNRLDEKPRQVVELSLQGLTPREISGRAGLTERSVYRLLERFKKILLERCEEDETSRP